MKKYQSILIGAVLGTCVASAFAQGTVVFNNNTGLVWRPSYVVPGPTEVPMPVGGGRVQLFWAPAGTAYTPWTTSLTPAAWYAANPGWTLGPLIGFTTPAAGKFNGGSLTLYPLAPGGSIDYTIIGWTGSSQSMDAALAAGNFVDVSSRFRSATGNPTTVPPGVPVPLSASFGGLHIGDTIPEPSSLGLVLLGVAACFGLRRHK